VHAAAYCPTRDATQRCQFGELFNCLISCTESETYAHVVLRDGGLVFRASLCTHRSEREREREREKEVTEKNVFRPNFTQSTPVIIIITATTVMILSKRRPCEHGKEPAGSVKFQEYPDQPRNFELIKK